MTHCRLTTLTTGPGQVARTLGSLGTFFANDSDSLIGCWAVESGVLNRILILEEAVDGLRSEQQDSAYGCTDLSGISTEMFQAFPSLPLLRDGVLGAIYEARTYYLKPEGLEPTLEGWAADAPRRSEISPLAAALYSLDGPLRIMHFWPYADYAERLRLRSQAIQAKVWPARGTPPWLTPHQVSEILLPAPFSPLR